MGIFIFNFRRDWPVILIILGLAELLNGLIGKRERLPGFESKVHTNPKIVKDEINKVLSELSSGMINSGVASDRIKDIKEKYQV